MRASLSRGLSLFLCILLLSALLPTAALADGYTEIGVIYNHQGVRADVGEELMLKVKTDLLSAKVTGAPSYQWYKATGNIYGTGTAIPGATGSSYKIPTDKTGTYFYYCVVTAKLKDGTTVSSESSEATVVRVNVQNIGEGFDAYDDGESGTCTVYSDREVPLGFGQMNYENKTVSCQWYACDADGFPTGGVLSRESVFLAPGIPESKMMEPFYYKCVVTAIGDKTGAETDEVLFCVMLYPVDVEPSIPFTDVPESEWYYESVANAYWLGLINGKTTTTYCPNDNVTNAEVVKLAVCLNILYNGGDPATDIANGDPWFMTYMDYAVEHNIIMYDMSETANYTASRDLFVYILSHALPDEAFTPINTIPDGAIPDVAAPGTEPDSYERSIYMFYRAGIVNGADDKGTFNPSSPIRRSEVATILVRMMEPYLRVGAPGELGK